MAKSSDIIKIGFDYRASLEQFEKETNGVFDGISEKAGKQRISIQLDAKNDKVIEKIKELQKLKLDKFTFEFGESGLAEQLKTFDHLEKKITEIINLSKGLGNITSKANGKQAIQSELDLYHMTEKRKVSYDEIIDKIQTIIKLQEKSKSLEGKKSSDGKYYQELFDEYVNWSDKDNTLNNITDRLKEIYSKFNGKITLIDESHIKEVAYLLDMVKGAGESLSGLNSKEKTFFNNKRFSNESLFNFTNSDGLLNEQIEVAEKELSSLYEWFNKFEGVSLSDSIGMEISRLTRDIQAGGKEASEYAEQLLKIFNIKLSDTTTVATPFKEEIDNANKLKEIANKTTITFEDFKTIIANLPSDKIEQLNKMLNRTLELTSDTGTSLEVMTSELGKYFTITGTRSSTSFFLSNEGEFTRKPNKNKTNFVDDEIYTKGMKYDPSDLADFAWKLQKQEQQALATAQAEEKLAETEKNLAKSTSTVDDSKFDELKADVTEIREELNGVKEKISAIDSEGFEHVKADVEKTIESVKELNNELTEMKSKLDSASTSPVETNISSGNSNIENELKLLQDKKKILSSLQEEYDEEEISEMSQIKSYQEILKLVTKIRDLKLDNTIAKGKVSGARQINDSELAKQYEDEASAIRKEINAIEDAMPLLIAFEDLTKKTISSFTTNDELNNFAIELYQCLVNLRGELGLINSEDFSKVSTEINTLKESVIKIPDKKKIEIELEYKSVTPNGELVYRGIAGKDGNYLNVSNDDGAVWWTSQKDLSQTRYTRNGTGSEFSGNLKAKNLFEFVSASTNWQKATNLGDGSDELSIKITDLYNKIETLKSKKEELIKTNQIESQEYKNISIELGSLESQYDAISKSKSNMYGTHMPNDWVKIAKKNGYDGLAIHNIDDDTNGLATSYAVWAKEQIENVKIVADTEEDFIRIHNEFLESASSTQIKDTFQGDKIQEATTSARELDRTLEGVEIPKESFDEVIAKFNIIEEKAKNIAKITQSSVWNRAKNDGKGGYDTSYTVKYKDGSSEILGENSNPQLLRNQNVLYDTQQAVKESNKTYKELIKTIQNYSEVQKRIAKNEAFDGDLALAQKLRDEITELQKQPILSSTQLEEANKRLVKLRLQVEKIKEQTKQTTQSKVDKALVSQLSSWKSIQGIREKIAKTDKKDTTKLQKLNEEKKGYQKQYLEAEKVLKANEDLYDKESQLAKLELERLETNEKINKLKLNNVDIGSVLSKGDSDLKKFEARKNQSEEYRGTVEKLKQSIEELRALEQSMVKSKLLPDGEAQKINEVVASIEEYINAIKNMPAGEKGSDALSRDKWANRIQEYMDKNTRLTREFREELESLIKTLRTGGDSVVLKDVIGQFEDAKFRIKEAKLEGKSFFDIFKNKAVYGYAAKLANYYLSFYDWIRYTRYAINALVELDSALLDLKKTTSMTENQLEDFYYASNDVAKQMGVTTAEIIEQASAWSRFRNRPPIW